MDESLNINSTECLRPYNSDFVGKFESSFRSILVMLVVLGVLIDILAFKIRSVMHGVVYLECLTRLVVMMVPNPASQQYNNTQYLYITVVTFFTLFTWKRSQIVALIIMQLLLSTFCQVGVYEKNMNVMAYAEMVIYLIGSLFTFICVLMALNHNSDLSRTLVFVVQEHEKLIDRMHEGTLILRQFPDKSKEEKAAKSDHAFDKLLGSEVLFMNEHAKKILQKFISKDFV